MSKVEFQQVAAVDAIGHLSMLRAISTAGIAAYVGGIATGLGSVAANMASIGAAKIKQAQIALASINQSATNVTAISHGGKRLRAIHF